MPLRQDVVATLRERLASTPAGEPVWPGKRAGAGLGARRSGDGRLMVPISGYFGVREKPGGNWPHSARAFGVGGECVRMGWHPRWGYVVGWTESTRQGPFLTRGPSLEPLFCREAGKTDPSALEDSVYYGRGYNPGPRPCYE